MTYLYIFIILAILIMTHMTAFTMGEAVQLRRQREYLERVTTYLESIRRSK